MDQFRDTYEWMYRNIARTKIAYVIVGMMVFTLAVWGFWNYDGIIVLMDEYKYWEHAATFAGLEWNSVSASPWYSYGYSLILVPIMKLFPTMEQMYHAALILNGIMMVGIFLLADQMVRRLFPRLADIECIILALCSTVYPAYLAQSKVAWTETFVYFLFWLVLWLFAKMLEDPNAIWCVATSLTVGYLYIVHNRMIVVVIAYVIVVAMLFLKRRIGGREILFIAAPLAALLIFNIYVKSALNDILHLTTGLNYDTNDVAGRMWRVKALFTWSGLKAFFCSVAGEIAYIGMASFLTAFIGFAFLVKFMYAVRNRMLYGIVGEREVPPTPPQDLYVENESKDQAMEQEALPKKPMVQIQPGRPNDWLEERRMRAQAEAQAREATQVGAGVVDDEKTVEQDSGIGNGGYVNMSRYSRLNSPAKKGYVAVYLYLLILLSGIGMFLISAICTMQIEDRAITSVASHFFYGRYTDAILGIYVLIGLASIYQSRQIKETFAFNWIGRSAVFGAMLVFVCSMLTYYARILPNTNGKINVLAVPGVWYVDLLENRNLMLCSLVVWLPVLFILLSDWIPKETDQIRHTKQVVILFFALAFMTVGISYCSVNMTKFQNALGGTPKLLENTFEDSSIYVLDSDTDALCYYQANLPKRTIQVISEERLPGLTSGYLITDEQMDMPGWQLMSKCVRYYIYAIGNN